jgi:hypothetical protein
VYSDLSYGLLCILAHSIHLPGGLEVRDLSGSTPGYRAIDRVCALFLDYFFILVCVFVRAALNALAEELF